MQSVKYQDKVFALILFMLCPFLAFMQAFWYYRKPWAKNSVWLFTGFFGFTLVVTEGKDASRYKDWFLLMGQQDSSLRSFLSALYSYETQFIDIIQPLISFLLSRVTSNPHILFAAFGLVFGYFYSRNIWYLLERAGHKIRLYNLSLIVTFVLLVGFWQINGFRFWTAAHVFLFGALPYLIEDKRKELWVTALSVLFHFSFMLPFIVFLMYIVLGNRLRLFFYFFLMSFFIYKIDFQIIRNVMLHLPGIFQERTEGYLSENYAETLQEHHFRMSWHAQYCGDALQLAVVALVIVTYFYRKDLITKNTWLVRLFSFSLIFNGIFNILGNVPSVGRFITLGNLFLFGFFFLYFQHDVNIRRNKIIMRFVLPAILFYCVVAIRSGFDFMSMSTVLGNPFTVMFGSSEKALMDFIK